MNNEDILMQKDVVGLFRFIVNNYSREAIHDLKELLRGYFENGTLDKFEGCPTGILELAVRDEVESYLSCTEDERIVKLNEDEWRELILDISYQMVYKEDSLWESFHDYISWELNHYLHDKDLD